MKVSCIVFPGTTKMLARDETLHSLCSCIIEGTNIEQLVSHTVEMNNEAQLDLDSVTCSMSPACSIIPDFKDCDDLSDNSVPVSIV
jgi:hypothetical protein